MRLVLVSYGGSHTVEEMVECLLEHSGSYSETNLPRGKGLSPSLLLCYLRKCHSVARRLGKQLIAHDWTHLVEKFPLSFPLFHVKEKLVVKNESWWSQWEMV